MTNLAAARVIVLADHAVAQRKRARRFWGTMGVVLRFDDRRNVRVDKRIRSAYDTRAVRSDARAPRGS